MKKFIQNKLKEQKGLTLIELLAVIVILAIIAAIAIPAIGNIIENSRVGAVKSDFVNAIAATELYLLDNPDDESVTLANLRATTVDDGGSGQVYLDDEGSLTAFTYVPASRLVDGSGTIGNVTIAADDATKADINAIENNMAADDDSIPDTITLTR